MLSTWVSAEERESLRDEINRRLRAIREAGYPVNLEELEAFHPYPESDADNAAPIYVRAFEAMRIDDEDRANPHLPFVGQGEIPESGERFSPDQSEVVAAFLEKNRDVFPLLLEASEIPVTRFEADYREGYEAYFPQLGRMRNAGRLLGLRILFLAEEGDSAGALRSVQTMAAISRALFQEPHVMGHLTGTAVNGLTALAVMELIQRTELSVDELRELERNLSDIPPEDAFLRRMCGERAMGISLYRRFVSESTSVLSLSYNSQTVTDRLYTIFFERHHELSGRWLRDFESFLANMESMVSLAGVSPENRTESPEWETLIQADDENFSNYYLISTIILPRFRLDIELDLIANHTRLNAVRLALRLQAERLESGRYPETLDEVVGPDETHMMRNLVSHEPFEYTVTANGFVIDLKADRIDPVKVSHSQFSE